MSIAPDHSDSDLSQRTEAARKLNEVCDAWWALQLERHPLWSTELGETRYNHVLPDYGVEGRNHFYAKVRELAAAFSTISEDALTGQDRITHEAMAQLVKTELDGAPFRDECWLVNPLHGPWSMITELAERQPTGTEKGMADLLSRYQAVPTMFRQLTDALREGLAEGKVSPRIGPERVIGQIKRMLEIPVETSTYLPLREHAPAFSDAQFEAHRQTVIETVKTHIYPSLQAFASFLSDEYLLHTRVEPGLCHMTQGREYYQFLIELYTSRTTTAEEIHQTGLDELKRIHAEMVAIAQETAGLSDIRAFVDWLRARPDQYLKTRDDVVNFNRAVVARAEQALPLMFSRLPSHRCQVRPVEAFREADSPSGYYSHAPEDKSRPAYYYVNTSRPDHRPVYNMEALAFHEAVPGHHLQISLAQELTDLHLVRRHINQTAYVEGWALYTERLCDEFGLYSSPFMRFGMLNYQAWRAARLVVDTGLHALGWSREKALQTMLDNTAHSANEATVEIDRYICMPGQALSYMTGRMAIDALRKEAKSRLGERFDLKVFHARVLENGSLPLATLERVVQHWLDEEGV